MKWLDKLVSWVLGKLPSGTASINDELARMDEEEANAKAFIKELEKVIESQKRKNIN